MPAQVISIATAKGGAGKTSIVAAVAGIIAKYGRSVAIVELDPQGDLGDDLGVREAAQREAGFGVAEAVWNAVPLGDGIQARERLLYFPAGPALETMQPTGARGTDSGLRAALAPLKDDVDVILIDTPPSAAVLQHVSLLAADWLLIPTAADLASVRALFSITRRLLEVEADNPGLTFLGVALWNVPKSATRIHTDVRGTLTSVVGKTVPLFDSTIRSAFATAYECRQRGLLPHELAERAENCEPYWQALAEGRKPERLPSSAQALAGDYMHLANEVLLRIREAKS